MSDGAWLLLMLAAVCVCAGFALYRYFRERGIDLFVGEDSRPLRNIEEYD